MDKRKAALKEAMTLYVNKEAESGAPMQTNYPLYIDGFLTGFKKEADTIPPEHELYFQIACLDNDFLQSLANITYSSLNEALKNHDVFDQRPLVFAYGFLHGTEAVENLTKNVQKPYVN